LEITKEIVIDPDEDIVLIRYSTNKEAKYQIKLFPLLSFRINHRIIKKGEKEFKVSVNKKVIFEDGSNRLFISLPASFEKREDWYYNFQYPVEKERGTNSEEDLYCPGFFRLENLKSFTVQISSEDLNEKDFDEVKERYLKRLEFNNKYPDFMEKMVKASNLLLVRNNIIAGYYWFGPWARDAFISLPGILLLGKRFEHAKNLIELYASLMKNGIIPIRISKEEDYISVDSSLWFIYAVYKYYQYTKDKSFLRSMYPKCTGIINAYIKGNEYFDLDGVFIRTKKAPLTWMDAKLGETVFTPRIGKPVEVNALWYNALSCLDYFAHELGKKLNQKFLKIRDRIEDYFSSIFVNNGIVLDVADPDDKSIRPNFILCFSLPFPILTNFRDYKMLVDEHLLTPYGLRSLSYKDEKFKPRYEGDWYSRDSAYHNGSVWPWLAGFYITASIKAGEKAIDLLNYFKPLYSMTYLPEIFDGLEPKAPKGCIIQAWSYGELIRAYYEDILPNLEN